MDPSTTHTDDTLVRSALAGDEAALEELARCHAGRLLRVARRLLAREDDARRAVADAFDCALASLGARQASVSVAVWLQRHLVQSALDALGRGAPPRI